MSRGVDKGDCAVDTLVLNVYLVGTDVLGDSTGFASDDVGVANGVEQTGLTVVDVTHNGDDRRASFEFVFFVFLVCRDVETEAFE